MSNVEKSSKRSISEDTCELLNREWEYASMDIP